MLTLDKSFHVYLYLLIIFFIITLEIQIFNKQKDLTVNIKKFLGQCKITKKSFAVFSIHLYIFQYVEQHSDIVFQWVDASPTISTFHNI